MTDERVLLQVEALAGDFWELLEGLGVVDRIGGVEYERRIPALRAWLWDAEGQPS